MPQQECSICQHPQAAAIDAALHAGTALRPCAALYRVSPSSLVRHNRHRRVPVALPAPPPGPPLAPDDQAWVDTYTRVHAVCVALGAFTGQDWPQGAPWPSPRWQEDEIRVPFAAWETRLCLALRARGLDPHRFAP